MRGRAVNLCARKREGLIRIIVKCYKGEIPLRFYYRIKPDLRINIDASEACMNRHDNSITIAYSDAYVLRDNDVARRSAMNVKYR